MSGHLLLRCHSPYQTLFSILHGLLPKWEPASSLL